MAMASGFFRFRKMFRLLRPSQASLAAMSVPSTKGSYSNTMSRLLGELTLSTSAPKSASTRVA